MGTASYFQYFTIAGIFNTLAFGVFLLLRRQGNAATLYMIVLMGLASVQALLNAFDNRDFFMAYPHLSRVSWLLPSLFGPLVYLFVRKVVREAEGLKLADALHLIPLALYLSFLLPWFMLSAAEKRMVLSDFEVHSLEDFGWLNQASIFLILIYLGMAFKELSSFKSRLKGHFSEIESLRYRWMEQFLFVFTGILLVSALGFYGRKLELPVLENFYHYNYALVVLMLYWMAYKWAGHTDLLKHWEENAPIAGQTGNKYAKSGLDVTETAAIFEKLQISMESERFYLKGDLTLQELSELTGVKRHHLSRAINEKTGLHFYDYVNGLRVKEMIRRMQQANAASRNLLGLAYDSGFNSKATFNSAFKKATGMTPSAFLKKNEYEPVGPVDSRL